MPEEETITHGAPFGAVLVRDVSRERFYERDVIL
jgi:hypothetical protein